MPALRQATLACLHKFGDSRALLHQQRGGRRPRGGARARSAIATIDLYGASYGTRVAELYMRRYPQRTHAVILDGVTYPEQAIGPDTPLDGERALRSHRGALRAQRPTAPRPIPNCARTSRLCGGNSGRRNRR